MHAVNLIIAPAEATTCSARAVMTRRRECLVKLLGPGDRLHCVCFCLSRWYHYLSIYGFTFSDQGQVTLQLRAFPIYFNPLKDELNPICHLLALPGGATIVVVSRLRVKGFSQYVLAGKPANIFYPCPNSLSVALCAGGKESAMEFKQQRGLLRGG